MWLAAIPSDAASTLAPDLMHVAMRRRLRLPLPLTDRRCGAAGHMVVGARSMRMETTTSPARVCCLDADSSWSEAVGPEGRVVPQQWLLRTLRRTSVTTTVAASTSLCTGQRPMARPCAATLRSSPL